MKKYILLYLIFTIFNSCFASENQNSIKITQKNFKKHLTQIKKSKIKQLAHKNSGIKKISFDYKKIKKDLDPDFSKKLDNAIKKEQQFKNRSAAAKATVLTGTMLATASYVTQKAILKNNEVPSEHADNFFSPKVLVALGCTITVMGALLYRKLQADKDKNLDDDSDLEELRKSSQNIAHTLHHYENDIDACKDQLNSLKTKTNENSLSVYTMLFKANNDLATSYDPLKLEPFLEQDYTHQTQSTNFIPASLFAGTSLMLSNFTAPTKNKGQHRPLGAIAADSIAGSLVNLFLNNIAPTVITATFWYLAYREFKKIFSAEERASVIALREHLDHSLQQIDNKFLICFNNFKRVDKTIKKEREHVDREIEKISTLLQGQLESQEKTRGELAGILEKLQLAKTDYGKMAQQLQKILPKMAEIHKNAQSLTETVKPLHKIKDYEFTVLQLQKRIEEKSDSDEEKSDNPHSSKKRRKKSLCCSTHPSNVVEPTKRRTSEHKED